MSWRAVSARSLSKIQDQLTESNECAGSQENLYVAPVETRFERLRHVVPSHNWLVE
jgi:hypothetical protein